MKALLANLSILATLVTYVYFQRYASESGDFLELPRKVVDAITHQTRSLASVSTSYSVLTCNGVDIDYNKSQEYVETINAPLFGSYRANYLQEDILSQKLGSDAYKNYGLSFIPLVAPWFILWILAIIINICLSCNKCCMTGCCKGCCGGCCKCCKKPGRDRKCCRIVSGFLGITFALGVVAAGAAGLSMATPLTDDFRRTRCAFFQAMDSIEYSNSSNNWLGLNGATNFMTTLDSIFTSTFNSSSYSNTTNDDIDTNSSVLKTQLTTTYTTYQAFTVLSANPGVGTPISPDVITNLGPIATTSTWLGAIEAESVAKGNSASNASSVLLQNYNVVKTGLAQFQSNIDSGQQNIKGLNSLFLDLETSFYDYTDKGDKIVSDYVKKGLLGVFAGAIGIACLALICPIFVCFFRKNCCNSFIFLAWESLAAVFLVGFIIGVVSLVVGIVVTQGCDALNKSVNEKGYLSNVTSFFSSSGDYVKYINTCLFDNGDLVTSIGVANTFSVINNIQKSIQNASTYYRATGAAASTTIPAFDKVLTDTLSGYLPLVASTSATDGTVYNLNNFNALADNSISGSTQSSTYSCTFAQDQWVLNTSRCTYSRVWTSPPDTDTTNVGSKTCLSITASTSASPAARYGPSTGACSNTPATDLANRKSKLKAQFDSASLAGGLAALQSDLQGTITTKYNKVATAIYGVTDGVAALNTTLNPVLKLVSDPTTGMLNNLNCTFFKAQLKTFHYTMCTGLVVTFYKITLAMLIMATFACFSSTFLFFFAKYMRAAIEHKDQSPDKYKDH